MHITKIIVLACSVLAFPVCSPAQSYDPIGSGSKYYCGYFGDGTNKIFQVKRGNNFVTVKYAVASKAVAESLRIVRKRIQTLNGIAAQYAASREVSKKKQKELKAIAKSLGADLGTASDFGVSFSEREIAVRNLLIKVQAEEANKVSELEGLKACKDNTRPQTTRVTITAKPMYFDYLRNRVFGVMLYTSAASGQRGVLDYPQRWFCIKDGVTGRTETTLFTGNPCYAHDSSDQDCSSLVPKGQLANFRTTVYDTYSDDGDPAAKAARIEGRLAEAASKYSAVIGRVRGKTGSYFEDEVQEDDCTTGW
jgi:hypothetical protein